MSRRVHTLWAILTSASFVLSGCHPTQPTYFFDDGDLSHYIDTATNIEYPDVHTESLPGVVDGPPPLSLGNSQPHEMWDLALEEAVQLALANSKVMRSLGGRFQSITLNPRSQVGEAPDALLAGRAITVYDPAISEAAPFGAADPVGPEAALSAFDANLLTGITWANNDRPQNVRATGAFGTFFVPIFEQDTGSFQATLSKATATGSQFSLRHNIAYDQNNTPSRQVPSDWSTNIEASFTQPLLARAGTQFTRIAGPGGGLLTNYGSPGFDGVVLARINTDITLADFEAGVRNLVSDVENAYWELYFAYRNLEASKTGQASALQTWKKIHALFIVGAQGGEAEKEAQSREQYFLFRGQVQTALNDLHRAENRLRYIMGLEVADGRLIRPSDEPTAAKVTFNWHETTHEALARSVELRRQKWQLKRAELELIAQRNLLLPELNATGTYRWLGLGDDLIEADRDPVTGGLAGTNAFQSLTSGDFQEWQFGLVMNVPIGFRQQLAGVRYYQLRLARARAVLQDQELELTHQIADALRALEFNYDLAQTNFNRRVAAERQVEAAQAAYDVGQVTLDLLLDAQRRRADAEIAYYRTIVDYTRAIMQVHFRKGSLLEYNEVYLAEGPWPAKAKYDAHRLARQRDASFYLDYGYTRPGVISQGPYLQNSKHDGILDGMHDELVVPMDLPAEVPSEELPAPPPAPSSTEPVDQPQTRKKSPRSAMGQSDGPSLDQPKLRSAAAGRKNEFDWGNLGLDASGRGTVVAKTKRSAKQSTKESTATELAITAEGSSAPAAAKKPASLITKSTIRRDPQVQPAKYDDWKPSSKDKFVADQSTGTTDRNTSGWKGAKR